MTPVRIGGLVAAACALALISAPDALSQKSNDTLRYPSFDPDAGIDTYTMPSAFANVWSPSVYDMLLGFDPEKGQFVGHLAKSFKQVDPVTYEFEMRDDVKWHDGQKLTADDVAYTLGYLVDPKVTLRYKAYWQWIKSVEKVAEDRVRVVAHQPVQDGLMMLASRTPIYPRHTHGAVANKVDFASRPIGTGPLRVLQMDKNTGIATERYDGYVASAVKPGSGVGKVTAVLINDVGTITATLMTGALDLAIDLPPDQTEAFRQSGQFEVTLGPPNVRYSFIGFPTTAWQNNKALADIRVRRAILMALDRPSLVKVRFGALAGLIGPKDALCSKEQLGCGFTLPPYPYDPVGARRLLTEAGYPDGFDVVISCFPVNVQEATAQAGMLRAIGIRATVRQHPTAQRQQLVTQGKVEIGVYGWSGGGMFEVSGQLGRHVESNDYGDPTLAKFAEVVPAISDDAERRKAVAKIFDHITEQAYAEVTVPNQTVITHTKEVVFNAGSIRADSINPHEFGWK